LRTQISKTAVILDPSDTLDSLLEICLTGSEINKLSFVNVWIYGKHP